MAKLFRYLYWRAVCVLMVLRYWDWAILLR